MEGRYDAENTGQNASFISITVSCLAATGDASAQQANQSPSKTDQDQLQEVVVTAQKRESTVHSTPISITAITGQDLAPLTAPASAQEGEYSRAGGATVRRPPAVRLSRWRWHAAQFPQQTVIR